MRFSSCLVVFSLYGVAWCIPKKHESKLPPNLLDVKLMSEGGSVVKVSIKNLGTKNIDFLQRGTILDENPVQKLAIISASGDSASFIGLHPRVNLNGKLNKNSFRTIKGGQTFETSIDAAAVYDLTAGGQFEVVAEGILPYASKRKIKGEYTYSTNKATLEVNGTAAAEIKHQLQRRNMLAPDCQQGRAAATYNSLAVCSNLAYVAGVQALSGNADQFHRYFRTKDPNARNTVAKRFFAVADECASRSNKAKTFCTDPRRLCRSDYISYTLGTEITNCDLYWTFPLINRACHGVGQATTTIHEMTHIEGLMNPSTDDFPGHYGWPALSTLPPEQARLNGDNYGFYANAIYTNDPNC